MFFTLFPSTHFNKFCHESQWVSNFLYMQKGAKSMLHNTFMQYLNHQVEMAYLYSSYQSKTSTIFSWVKSFIPGNDCFQARIKLAASLETTSHLYMKIMIHHREYVRNTYHNYTFNSSKQINETIKKKPNHLTKRLFNNDTNYEASARPSNKRI